MLRLEIEKRRRLHAQELRQNAKARSLGVSLARDYVLKSCARKMVARAVDPEIIYRVMKAKGVNKESRRGNTNVISRGK